ncbi:MAG: hypothetical protein Q9190_004845, partial [Brigantiaea leucoxantha]
MDSVRSHTADEIVQMMNQTPLFMTSLENAEDDGTRPSYGENVLLEAIKALQYEGTKAEIALGFKERGNEAIAEKRWKDAKEFYTKGILALKQEPQEQPKDPISEFQKERAIEEACYINRALCNLELHARALENFRSCLSDTAHTLSLTPTNQKAHYRSALALLSLSRLPEAHDITTRGLTLTSPSSSQHSSFKSLLSKITTAQSALALKQQQAAQRTLRLQQEHRTLLSALAARGIKQRASSTDGVHKQPELEDAVIHLSPDPLNPASELVFPLLFLYPLVAESDFVKKVSEREILGEVLKVVLPAPWDEQGEYAGVERVEMFAETAQGG